MPFDADDALIEPPDDSFSEFDAAATPNPPGPSPSSHTPETVKEPLRESGEEQQEPADTSTFAPIAFDERHREPFIGLTFLGYLTEEFWLWGHKFLIATPTQSERLQIGKVIDSYRNTWAEDQAWMTALVAAYLIEVDDEPLPEPVMKSKKSQEVRERFEWVSENLFREVVNAVYQRCLALDKKVSDVLEAMGEA